MAENETQDDITAYFLNDEGDIVGEMDKQEYLKVMGQTLAMEVDSVNSSLRNKNFEDDVETKSKAIEKVKGFEGSNQSTSEVGYAGSIAGATLESKIAPRPYDPESFATFMEVNSVHKQAVQAKVRDSVGREFKLVPKFPIKKKTPQDEEVTETNQYDLRIEEEDFQKDCKTILEFIEDCNEEKTFQEILSLAAMDREAIGWGAFEVIRQGDGKIAKLERLPAVRLKVLEGFDGYLETSVAHNSYETKTFHTYYQPFGEKVVAEVKDPFKELLTDGKEDTSLVKYKPERDGELNLIENKKLRWNLKDRNTGEDLPPTPQNLKKAANEVLFLPNNHINSIYYGFSDIVPAIPSILNNVHIADYLSQFFENNCVPRYIVIIKAGRVSDKFKKTITDYFKKEVKGKYGSTMVLTLSNLGGKDVDIEFKRIDAEQKEADFLETKKANNQDVMVAHGIPPALLAIHETASLGSGKGNAQSELYKDRFVVPSQRFYSQRINKLFRLGLGVTNALLEFDPMDIKDALTTAQVLNLLLIQGVLTINEARSRLGLEPIEGGDVPVVRVREGSFVRVSDIPNIQTKLKDEEFEVETSPEGEKQVTIDSLIGNTEDA